MIHQARHNVAARYPEALVDTLGRIHPSIVRRSILAGHWDSSATIREELARLEALDASKAREQ